MKHLSYMLAISLLAQTGLIHAGQGRDTLRGGLIGAATGALVAEMSSDISSRTAIPLFAGIGALAGYTRHHYRNRDNDTYYAPAYAAPALYAYHPAGYRQRWQRHPTYRERVGRVTTGPVVQKNTPAPTANRENRHPGVSLIPVSFTTESGFPITINVIKVGDTYTGPRGETYDAMPDVTTLREIYKP